MHLANKRQDALPLPDRIFPGGLPLDSAVSTIVTTTYFGYSTLYDAQSLPVVTNSSPTLTVTTTVRQADITYATPTPISTLTSTISPSPTPTQSASSSQTSDAAAASPGIPLSTLIPAIVVPVVILALVAPVALYFFLTRHDRQRRKSQASSKISSRAYPETRMEFKGPSHRHSSSETGISKASEIMNFDLGPGVEKSLPAVSVTRAPDNAYERPDSIHVNHGFEAPIGQAISRYSGSHDSARLAVDPPQNRSSIQELSEENMRIARLANDSKASFRGRELDDVSDISAPEDRTSRHVGRRGIDELSDVSSMYEDVTAASSDRGGGILGNQDARRSGPFR